MINGVASKSYTKIDDICLNDMYYSIFLVTLGQTEHSLPNVVLDHLRTDGSNT